MSIIPHTTMNVLQNPTLQKTLANLVLVQFAGWAIAGAVVTRSIVRDKVHKRMQKEGMPGLKDLTGISGVATRFAVDVAAMGAGAFIGLAGSVLIPMGIPVMMLSPNTDVSIENDADPSERLRVRFGTSSETVATESTTSDAHGVVSGDDHNKTD